MLLTELFTQPVDYQIEHESDENITAVFSIGEQQYRVGVVRYENTPFKQKFPEHINHYWTVAFSLQQQRSGSFNDSFALSGTGNAATVFATVVAFIQQMVSRHNINAITFDASFDEPSRVRLYSRLAKTLSNKFGWKFNSYNLRYEQVYILYKEQG